MSSKNEGLNHDGCPYEIPSSHGWPSSNENGTKILLEASSQVISRSVLAPGRLLGLQGDGISAAAVWVQMPHSIATNNTTPNSPNREM
jgi:hypothetical protein